MRDTTLGLWKPGTGVMDSAGAGDSSAGPLGKRNLLGRQGGLAEQRGQGHRGLGTHCRVPRCGR